MKGSSKYILLWSLSVVATVFAFVVHLALRGKVVTQSYELGRAKAEQARLRDAKRILEVEAASYKTPERVEIVARTLLGMEPLPPERLISLGTVSGPQAPVSPEKPAESSETKTSSADLLPNGALTNGGVAPTAGVSTNAVVQNGASPVVPSPAEVR